MLETKKLVRTNIWTEIGEEEEEEEEEKENGNDGGGFSAGSVSEAEEGSRIEDRHAWSLVFSQYALFLLRREHSSDASEPPIHHREALSLHQPRIPRRFPRGAAGNSTSTVDLANLLSPFPRLLPLFWSGSFLSAFALLGLG